MKVRFFCPKPDQVITRRGYKSVYTIVNADEKESLTSLFMVNAAESMVPPMTMYWYKRVPYSMVHILNLLLSIKVPLKMAYS